MSKSLSAEANLGGEAGLNGRGRCRWRAARAELGGRQLLADAERVQGEARYATLPLGTASGQRGPWAGVLSAANTSVKSFRCAAVAGQPRDLSP